MRKILTAITVLCAGVGLCACGLGGTQSRQGSPDIRDYELPIRYTTTSSGEFVLDAPPGSQALFDEESGTIVKVLAPDAPQTWVYRDGDWVLE